MAEIMGAEPLVKCLTKERVRHVFGVSYVPRLRRLYPDDRAGHAKSNLALLSGAWFDLIRRVG
jgi:hypothetical protein